jgi:hypothetical protein
VRLTLPEDLGKIGQNLYLIFAYVLRAILNNSNCFNYELTRLKDLILEGRFNEYLRYALAKELLDAASPKIGCGFLTRIPF